MLNLTTCTKENFIARKKLLHHQPCHDHQILKNHLCSWCWHFVTLVYSVQSAYASLYTFCQPFCSRFHKTLPYCLKTLDTIGNCQRPVFSLGVYQHMHKITNPWKFELGWSLELRDNYERKKTILSHEVVCFQMLDFETSNSKSEVSKSNSWKITSFSKTTSLQREPFFLTMFYIINLSPLLVTKWGFMLITILSNYQ